MEIFKLLLSKLLGKIKTLNLKKSFCNSKAMIALSVLACTCQLGGCLVLLGENSMASFVLSILSLLLAWRNVTSLKTLLESTSQSRILAKFRNVASLQDKSCHADPKADTRSQQSQWD